MKLNEEIAALLNGIEDQTNALAATADLKSMVAEMGELRARQNERKQIAEQIARDAAEDIQATAARLRKLALAAADGLEKLVSRES